MHLLRFRYFLASEGCPDATPAGIIAVDLGFNFEALDADDESETEDVVLCCAQRGFFDDSDLQLNIEGGEGVTWQEVDPHHAVCLTNDLILPTFVWEAMKASAANLNYVEHSIAEDDRQNAIFFEQYKKEHPEQFEFDEEDEA